MNEQRNATSLTDLKKLIFLLHFKLGMHTEIQTVSTTGSNEMVKSYYLTSVATSKTRSL